MKNKMLLVTDNRGRTAWHLAAENGHVQVLHNVGSGLKRK